MMAYGPNSSCMHYFPEDDNNAVLKFGPGRELIQGPLLIDSGFHYRDGTTDISRTLWLGENPSYFLKEVYTRSLQGLIDVCMLRKKSMSGVYLDQVAKEPLSEIDLNYNCATGHGIGHCLNVHEMSVRVDHHAQNYLTDGMVIAIEPGYYKEGEFGVRIEDDLIVRKATDGMLWLENMTFAPYCRDLIDASLLTDQ